MNHRRQKESAILRFSEQDEEWCRGAELNHRRKDFQSFALPLSYPGKRYKLNQIVLKRGQPTQAVIFSGQSFALPLSYPGKRYKLNQIVLKRGQPTQAVMFSGQSYALPLSYLGKGYFIPLIENNGVNLPETFSNFNLSLFEH